MEGSRLFTAFARLVDALTARIDYQALYPAAVVKQNADGTLDLQPESDKLGALASVPIRLGIPGASVKVSGGRVLIQFENGEADRPVATLWDTSALVELSLNGGATPVAKEGSSITGSAGPFPVVAVVSTGAGAPALKVP